MTTCSVIISTYNWPEALRLCLISLMHQSRMADEIIICDDGSRADTQELIEEIKKDFTVPVRHVWQEDHGFQLAKIRNKGLAIASGDYIIQIDGDLIVHRDFIKDHLNLKRPKYFTTGGRVLLSKKTTELLLTQKSISVNKFSTNNKNYFNGLHIPFLQNILSLHYKTRGRFEYYVKGCNMAFWKDDLFNVNGYNEDFSGWGKEDSELAIRLINSGVKKQFLKFGGICYHLFHREANRNMEKTNTELMMNSVRNKVTTVVNGLSKYLANTNA